MVLHQAELRSPVASGKLLTGIRTTSMLLQKILLRGIGHTVKRGLCRWRLSKMTKMQNTAIGKIGFGVKLKKGDWVLVWVGVGLTLQAIAGFARKAWMANALHARAVAPDRSMSARKKAQGVPEPPLRSGAPLF